MSERYPNSQWTESHALFAHMGGFRLVYRDGQKEHLYGRKYAASILDGSVEVPEITAEEVKDKSKGDAIAKSIVLLQTTWFVVQAVQRASQHLTVTALELTTLAHTLLNAFIYWCWWNKPLNVRFPMDIGVRPKQEEQSPDEATLLTEDGTPTNSNQKDGNASIDPSRTLTR
ncbi:hypothetical protein AX17_005033 [Amanita inopinata Kibby_2008]|nr:hypothetical protein AX17_005033 [Amanita inopinata Kibby_2008]